MLGFPGVKPKTIHSKKVFDEAGTSTGGRRSQRPIAIETQALPVEEQATAFLMKTCGILGELEKPNNLAHDQLGEQFVEPLKSGIVGNVRSAFGLPEDGAEDRLAPLIIDAEA